MDANLEQLSPKQALKKYFGYDSFRPMQEEIIRCVYEKRDAVVVMPTGGGKSICYQIPAITLPGVAIIVSPLIALMKDQVEGLQQNGVEAAFINSTLSPEDAAEIARLAEDGKLRMLYVSPEKLTTEAFSYFLQNVPVSLFAVDEAHCISAWGHDFRPEYTKLGYLKKQFPHVPVMALTATADKVTRQDIMRQLGMENPAEFLASFDRPNLSLNVLPGQKRYKAIIDFIKAREGESGIIYCLSRKSTERIASKLTADGINAGFYHAGMAPRAREKAQEDFINDKVDVMVATIAFGMGIDKSNVRFVIHYNLPKNIESFYQEIGRAGRDGLPSDTVLFYSFADVMQLRNFVDESGQKELQLAKLERMQQYADAQVCRRRILLNYFGQNMESDCGNCDVCKNPPEHVEGTVLAQKALSAVFRTDEKVGITLLIDILRGSRRREIMEKGYHKIKTYGIGADISYFDWQYYVHQFLNLGLLDIAYNEGNTLKLNDSAKEVLFEGKKINIVRPTVAKKAGEKAKDKTKTKSKSAQLQEDIFEALRQLRKEIATEKGIPAYLVFSDATLKDMAKNQPVTVAQMQQVSGVGAKKLQLYGDEFMSKILSILQEKMKDSPAMKGNSHLATLAGLQANKSPEEIAKERNIQVRTVMQHIARLYEEGHDIEISKYISGKELGMVLDAIEQTGESQRLKPIFDAIDGQLPYEKIGLGLSFYRKREADNAKSA